MNKCNTFRIIFRNMDGKYDSGEDRLQDIIKPLYWTDPPADWTGFDGDIEIHKEQELFFITTGIKIGSCKSFTRSTLMIFTAYRHTTKMDHILKQSIQDKDSNDTEDKLTLYSLNTK